MGFICISNEVSSVNRLFLEKLGLSTKADDPRSIGQFGSGSKFAPIAALRNGWRWVNVGEDELGSYQMEYVAQEEDGINCVYYLYDNKTLKPSSFTVDAGKLSWDNAPFQIFREAFANALDEFTVNKAEYDVDFVDEIKHIPGRFCVYLSDVPELRDICEDFDKYFSIERDSVAGTGYGKVFPPHGGALNVYYKGVLVFDGDKDADSTTLPPFFNYEFNDLTLNEERRVRSLTDIHVKIMYSWGHMSWDMSNLDLCKKVLRDLGTERYETTISTSYISWVDWNQDLNSNPWYQAWCSIYGEDAAAYIPEMKNFTHVINTRDYRPVECKNFFLYDLLKANGVETIDSLMGEDVNFDFVKHLSREKRSLFDKALKIVKKHEPEWDAYIKDIKFYTPRENQLDFNGFAYIDKGFIYISTDALGGDLGGVVGTLVHEFDHIYTENSNHDARFRGTADSRIGRLILKLEGET